VNKIGLSLSTAAVIAFVGIFAVIQDARQIDPAVVAVTQTAASIPSRIPSLTPSPSIVPTHTSLASLTPSKTLLPPPTLEPPTSTPPASQTPSITPIFTPIVVDVPGLIGLETNTATPAKVCVVRKDWKLTYTVQAQDALIAIAKTYGTDAATLAAGNCLHDANAIRVGEVLQVPGNAPPSNPGWDCSVPVQLVAPMNYAASIAGSGSINFQWTGPTTPRYLIRIFDPNGTKYEYGTDLAQYYSLNLSNIPLAGTYTWSVYPLDLGFGGVCTSGGPWTFIKVAAPTAAPTSASVGKTPVVGP